MEGKRWRKACAWPSILWNACRHIYFPYDIAPIMCFASLNVWSIMPAWQDPEIQMEERQALVFSLRDFAFGLSLPLCWLVERVSKKPYHVFPVSLHFLCTMIKMHIFPLHREMLGKENVQNLSARSSVSSAAEPSHSRQAGCMLTLEAAKQRRETHSTHSGVPKDYFCSCQPAPSLDNNEGMLVWEAPCVPPHFADWAFAFAILDPLIFLPGSSIF